MVNYLEWHEDQPYTWRDVSYAEHIYEGYQKDMQSGEWSAFNQKLEPSTINLRVNEVCSFLEWAAARGHRPAFSVLTERISRRADVGTRSNGHQSVQVEARIGRVRLNPDELRLPTVEEIKRWLHAVEVRHGKTKALMCRLVLESGIRREEAACWRQTTLPTSIDDWYVLGNQVRVSINYGCKGPDYGSENGDKIGPRRHIWIPLSIAGEIREYWREGRMAAQAKWIRGAASSAEKRARMTSRSPYLFLSEKSGRRITAKALYEAWTDVSYLPFKGWSVHGGRHWWACTTLLQEHSKRLACRNIANASIPLDWISGNAMSDIQLLIRPQLGHVDKRTSESYVRWVVRNLEAQNVQIAYQDSLDQIESSYP